MIHEGLILGISTGTYCIVSCAPAAVPFIFSEKIDNWRQNSRYVAMMLLGRLVAYVSVGFIIGALGGYAVNYLDPVLQRKLLTTSNILIGVLMIASGMMYNFPHLKLCKEFKRFYRAEWSSILYGLFTGFNICPPFFMAAARVFGKGNGADGMLYFFMFFLGTSIYFTPLLGVHFFKKHMETIRMVARLSLILMGVYFLIFQGLFSL